MSFDRSREVSGQQTSNIFSGSFMCSQFQVESNHDQNQLGYDLDGNAHLVSVLQVSIFVNHILDYCDPQNKSLAVNYINF